MEDPRTTRDGRTFSRGKAGRRDNKKSEEKRKPSESLRQRLESAEKQIDPIFEKTKEAKRR